MHSKTLWASIKQRKCDKKGSIEHVLTFTPKLAKWSHKLDLRDGPYVASSRMNSRINVYGMWLSNISLHVQQATKSFEERILTTNKVNWKKIGKILKWCDALRYLVAYRAKPIFDPCNFLPTLFVHKYFSSHFSLTEQKKGVR